MWFLKYYRVSKIFMNRLAFTAQTHRVLGLLGLRLFGLLVLLGVLSLHGIFMPHSRQFRRLHQQPSSFFLSLFLPFSTFPFYLSFVLVAFVLLFQCQSWISSSFILKCAICIYYICITHLRSPHLGWRTVEESRGYVCSRKKNCRCPKRENILKHLHYFKSPLFAPIAICMIKKGKHQVS